MNDKKISIIIPVYNVQDYLDRCLESVTNQSYSNLEIILIDDGSPDNCPKICDDWAKKDNRIKVLHQKNAGVSIARNNGIDNATGDFICFVDSDDFLDVDYAKKLLKKQQEKNSDIVVCRYYEFRKENSNAIYEPRLSEFALNNKIECLYSVPKSITAYLWRMFFKKEIFNDLRFDTSLHYLEDLNLITRMILKNYKVDFLDEYLYYYCYNFQSVSRVKDFQHALMRHKGVLKCCKLLRDNGYNDLCECTEFDSYLRNMFQFSIYDKNQLLQLGIKEFNDKSHYKNYLKYNKSFKAKIKAFLGRHEMFFIIKVLNKLKG